MAELPVRFEQWKAMVELQLDFISRLGQYKLDVARSELLAAVEQKLASHPGSQLKLVSNLPYNIATPIITNLLATELPVASMTVTIQKELADRMMASIAATQIQTVGLRQ